jgi:exonuclease III
MKVKINQKLMGSDGEPLQKEKGLAITFKDIAIHSILSPVQGDDEKKKWDKYEIYRKLQDAKGAEVELKTEEVAILKLAIGKIQPPLIMGQCWEIIESK